MSSSEGYAQALSEAVAQWRMQENICISFYTFYIYYILTTLKEEVAITFPQKWNFGKALSVLIRYGMCVFITLQLTRNFRNYYPISPIGCKVLWIIYDFAHWFVHLACDVSLGLCLAALLRARWLYIIPLLLICVTPSCLGLAFNVVGNIQYPADPITSLDAELGYPCYVPSDGAVLTFVARDTRAYVSLATTAALLTLGISTTVLRYKGQNSGLVKVLRRDGGLYYLLLTGMRVVAAILSAPSVMPADSWDGSLISVLYVAAWDVFIPIIAQRLMINMRMIDYGDTRPAASTLLFAAPDSDSQTAQEVLAVEDAEMSHGESTSLADALKV
ncbi:hypothetical protein FA13DRAFT_1727271 [Coprinellus micaceus]|uniref:Uncharacterized protein n=1 Tax=Coprinellus micaceus TaxID=71717 RepID=A0A4Y7TRV1_COPMI|nr:hypothetical protein FA13DRAFT_1727271 [Coprinellus micaceus]